MRCRRILHGSRRCDERAVAAVAAFTVYLAAEATPPAPAVLPADLCHSHVLHGQLGKIPDVFKIAVYNSHVGCCTEYPSCSYSRNHDSAVGSRAKYNTLKRANFASISNPNYQEISHNALLSIRQMLHALHQLCGSRQYSTLCVQAFCLFRLTDHISINCTRIG